MSANRKCPQCGAEQSSDALEGLCQDCLGRAALRANTVSTSQEGGHDESIRSPYPHPASGHPLPSDGRGAGGEGQRFGDYELLGEIARGGMGVVYKARQISLNRTVALKMISGGQFASKEFVHRFRVEASAAAVLQHPNIVAVHEVGVHDGHHFFSMDYVAGKNLAEIVRDDPLPANRAARYVQKIAEAIHYAHESGILHRDLKPSNVIIGANDQPRITDFGLAKQLNSDSAATLTGEVMGTPGYMPPEQASGNRGAVKAWSDVYSIGAILYHLLTGRAPFAAGSLEVTLEQMLHQDPVSPRLLNPAVPRDLNTICLKCLEKDPGRRYTTAGGLAKELNRFLNDEPILARPASTFQKALRWCRKNPALAWSTATALLLLLTVAVGSPIAAFRISHERREADVARKNEIALRQQTEADKKRAEVEGRKSQKVAQFSKEILGGLTPSVSFDVSEQREVAKSLGLLATVFRRQGKFVEAESVLREALAIYRKLFGNQHRTVSVSLLNLGEVLFDQNKLPAATEAYREALAINRSVLPDHPYLEDNIDGLADLLRRQKLYVEAEPLYREVLAMRRKRLGDGHGDVAFTMNRVAEALENQGKLSDAESLYRKALTIRKIANHKDLPSSINHVVSMLEKQGKRIELEQFRRELAESNAVNKGDLNSRTATK